jgi:hypothetical protein
MPRLDEVQQDLEARIQVTNQLVTLAKRFLLASIPSGQTVETSQVLEAFAADQGTPRVEHVVVHEGMPLEPQVEAAARNIECRFAGARALWELVGAADLVAIGIASTSTVSQGYTTVYGNSGGHTGGWRLESMPLVAPSQVHRPVFSGEAGVGDGITDPDLYVDAAGLATADAEVQEAARDAVFCLRAGLHRPAAVMLGKVMEGAWIETGLALAHACPGETAAARLTDLLQSPDESLARKIAETRELYQKADWFSAVYSEASVRPRELEWTVVWSNVLRTARNGIHMGGQAPALATYEKVVTLFLQGEDSLRRLYQIRDAALSQVQQSE